MKRRRLCLGKGESKLFRPTDISSGRLTQDTIKLDFKADIELSEIVYRTLLADDYQYYYRSHATGTTNLGLPREDFLHYQVVIPSDAIKCTFNALSRQIRDRFDLGIAENITLSGLRDMLLPKLLSGAIVVADKLTMLENSV